MFAGIGSFPYNLMLLLHILAVIVAFAPSFVWPILRVRLRKQGTSTLPSEVGSQIAPTNFLVHGPAVLVAGLLGIFSLLLSDEAYEFSQTWVSTAFVLWFLMLGVLFLGVIPAERKAADAGDTPGADARVNMFGGMLHLLLILMLVDMIWKPGL